MGKTQKKRVLILTLGTGAARSGGEPYRKASYKFRNEGETITTAYVAEPLVREFRPDMIFVIGTIKSAWLEFYQYFTTEKKEEAELAFCELDPANGKDMPVRQLQEAAEVIDGIFAGGMDRAPFSPEINIRAIVTRYGLNDEELLENYRLISGISAYMDRNTDYEIAFDITHSFRSLPIYNLIILNYLKVISDSRLEISHVYYGNFDAGRENGNIAPILDLQDLMHVMDLTSSVNEFKNTGNCRTLFTQIPKSEQELREALEEFDWATQVNSFDKVQESLARLLRLTEQERPTGSRYADLSRMIRTVLSRKFLKWEETEGAMADRLEGLSLGERRLMTSNWYLNQNRYGQAVATACEALKSYLVPVYLKEVLGRDEAEEKECLNENYLRASVQRLGGIAVRCRKKRQTEGLSGTEEFFLRLEENRRKAVQIRNRFAHNLREGEIGGTMKLEPEEEKICIRRLIEGIEELRDRLSRDYGKVAAVYAREEKKKARKSGTGAAERESIVVITEQMNGVPYWRYRKSNNGEYDVYRFEKKVIDALRKNRDKIENALLLRKILQNQGLDHEHTRLYLYGLDRADELLYTMILQEENFRLISRVSRENPFPQPVKKVQVRLDREYYEEYRFKEELEVLQFTNLLQVTEGN